MAMLLKIYLATLVRIAASNGQNPFWQVMEGDTSTMLINADHVARPHHIVDSTGPALLQVHAPDPASKTVSTTAAWSKPDLAPMVYVSSILAMSLGICWFFQGRGAATCLSIVCNVVALSTMSLLIRNIFVNARFQYPTFVTATHAFVTGLVGITTLICKNGVSAAFAGFPDRQTWLRGIIPVGIATALSLGLANFGLWLTNAHFYEMLGSSGFLVTAAVGVMMGRPFELQLLPMMLSLTFGTMVLSFGEMNFSVIGALCILGATFCRAGKAQIQGLLMCPGSGLMQLDPIELVVCTSMVSLVIMLVWSAVAEGLAPWQRIMSLKVFFPVLLAALNASVLNIASIFVIRSLGPVAQQCVGQLKSVLCCVGAVAAFNEAISHQQAIGYTIVMASVFWYNHKDMEIKAAATKASKEVAETKPLNAAKVV